MSDFSVAMIAAVADNNVIGSGGGLPFRLPTDLKHFKAKTMGHTIVMGRRTFLSLGKPLPRRRTIVVTRTPLTEVETAPSLETALMAAGRPVFLGGGARIYEDGLALADTLFLTRVHASPEGDTLFPALPDGVFRCESSEAGVQSPKDECAFTFEVWRRT
ncbi:MAG: dihydrofolate reductase [Pseudomonadota bacterium]